MISELYFFLTFLSGKSLLWQYSTGIFFSASYFSVVVVVGMVT